MRRQQEGYILAYVLIVTAVLCVLCTTVCTMAIKAIQVQENSMDQIQARYTAQGKIETIAGKLEEESFEQTLKSNANFDSVDVAWADAENAINDFFEDLGVTVKKVISDSCDTRTYTYTVEGKAEESGTTITAEWEVTLTVTVTDKQVGNPPNTTTYKWEVSSIDYEYTGYTITYGSSGGGG